MKEPLDQDFYQKLLVGISRCKTMSFVEEYYRRWALEIKAHPKREDIIAHFGKRKAELQEQVDKQAEKDKYAPKGRRK